MTPPVSLPQVSYQPAWAEQASKDNARAIRAGCMRMAFVSERAIMRAAAAPVNRTVELLCGFGADEFGGADVSPRIKCPPHCIFVNLHRKFSCSPVARRCLRAT